MRSLTALWPQDLRQQMLPVAEFAERVTGLGGELLALLGRDDSRHHHSSYADESDSLGGLVELALCRTRLDEEVDDRGDISGNREVGDRELAQAATGVVGLTLAQSALPVAEGCGIGEVESVGVAVRRRQHVVLALVLDDDDQRAGLCDGLRVGDLMVLSHTCEHNLRRHPMCPSVREPMAQTYAFIVWPKACARPGRTWAETHQWP